MLKVICCRCNKEHNGIRRKCNECREDDKEYRTQNKEKIAKRDKAYYKKNKIRISKRNASPEINERRTKSNKRWRLNNKGKIIKYRQENKGRKSQSVKDYRLKYPERQKAQKYAKRHNQRDNACSQCGDITNLDFHHTDYEKNEGFTVCKPCHMRIHRRCQQTTEIS